MKILLSDWYGIEKCSAVHGNYATQNRIVTFLSGSKSNQITSLRLSDWLPLMPLIQSLYHVIIPLSYTLHVFGHFEIWFNFIKPSNLHNPMLTHYCCLPKYTHTQIVYNIHSNIPSHKVSAAIVRHAFIAMLNCSNWKTLRTNGNRM